METATARTRAPKSSPPPFRAVRPRQAIPVIGPDLATEEPSMAQAVDRLAAAVEAHTEMARPAHEVVAGLGDRLDGLCRFIKGKGPWILASVPTVLVGIGAVSPNAAAALKAIISAIGAG